MNKRAPEPEVIYQYAEAELKAERVGLYLSATRVEFVIRDASHHQEFARCATLAEVNKALDRQAAALRQG